LRLPVLSLIALAPLLAACETTSRLPSFGNPFGASERAMPDLPRNPAASPRIETAPTARIDSAPLEPPPGAELAAPPAASAADAPPAAPMPPPQQSARVETPRAPAAEPAAPTRSSVTGNWSLKEAAGSCRVTLSSSPKLDLYGASTSGCQSRDLQRVTAWELHGDEVYLYEPGGAVTARLKARGQSMSGSLAKTGAPISLSK